MTKIEKIFFTCFIFILALVPLLWFHGNQILLGYDNVFPLNPIAFLSDRIFSWTQTIPFGADQSGTQGSLIIHFIDSVPILLGFSAQVAQKFVFSFWFFFILFSAYFLIWKLERARLVTSPYLRYIFPVLYAFNFYILQAWWIAERTKFSLVVATPLILSILLPMITQQLSLAKIVKNAGYCVLILSLFNGGGWAGLSLYGGLLLALAIVYCFYLVNPLLRNKKNIILMTAFYPIFGIWFFLLNAYTFLPFIFVTLRSYGAGVSSSGGLEGIIDWAKYLSENTGIVNLLRLQGIPDWYNNPAHPYSSFYFNNPLLVFSSFIFAALILFSLLQKKEERKGIMLFFFLLFLTSLVFTAGIHYPLGFIPQFFLQYIPGFAIFRSLIFKFGYAYWLSASFLIALSISQILNKLLFEGKSKLITIGLRVTSLLIIILLILAYHFPYFTGDIFRLDKTSVSSRVAVPSYVYDFSKWWASTPRKSKILLLPMLNKDWLFEQYDWNYESLFPILGDFGITGAVENNDTLLSGERGVLTTLYKSINSGDQSQTDSITAMLGIRYLLVRKDFAYTIPDQETDNPYTVESKLSLNTNLTRIKSFGPWDVYQYKNDNPSIFTKSSVTVAEGGLSVVSEVESNPLVIDTNSEETLGKTISESIFSPTCNSCDAEKQDVQVLFLKPKILIDSPLYDTAEFLRTLKVPKNESVDQKTSRLLGDSLSMVSQLNEVFAQEKGEYYVSLVQGKLNDIFTQLSNEYPYVTSKATNPYSLSIIIEQYLNSESDDISSLATSNSNKNNSINLEEILFKLHMVNDKYKRFYDSSNINIKKAYNVNLFSSGSYLLQVNKESLGKIKDDDYNKTTISIDGKTSNVLNQSDIYLNFGNVSLENGSHHLFIASGIQQNVLKQPVIQHLAGSTCYSSYIENFSPDKSYDLKFSSENNFDPDFYYFIDDGKERSTLFPYLVYHFPLLGAQVKQNRIIISEATLPISGISDSLRVAFCAPSLNDDLYKNNIKDLSVVELTNPKIILSKKELQVFPNPPSVDIIQKNQVHYEISVKDASGPYYLVFTQRFSSGWHSSIGEHFMGNEYNNVWFIDKTGNYTIDLAYSPQRYFLIGILVSFVTLLSSLFFLFKFRK